MMRPEDTELAGAKRHESPSATNSRSPAQMRQLAKAIERMQTLATDERLCKCDQCKAIRDVLKAWRIK